MELIIKPVILNYIIKDDGYYNKIDELVEMVDLYISDDSDNYSVSSGSSGSSSAPPNSVN